MLFKQVFSSFQNLENRLSSILHDTVQITINIYVNVRGKNNTIQKNGKDIYYIYEKMMLHYK